MFEKPSPEPLTGDLHFTTGYYLSMDGTIPINALKECIIASDMQDSP